MQILIRQEQLNDHPVVAQVIEAAFKEVVFSDQREHLLVARLRKSDAFIPDLSLVAELDNKVVGHIILSKILIKHQDQSTISLALAPVSVHPDHQSKGIGGQLILAAHQQAKALNFQSIILLGHADYYPRFGYQKASSYNIQLPFEAPDENCMAIALFENSLEDVQGIVEYSKAFYE